MIHTLANNEPADMLMRYKRVGVDLSWQEALWGRPSSPSLFVLHHPHFAEQV